MMNPNLLMDLARERHRDLLEDASRRRRHMGIDGGLSAPDDVLRVGRSARVIDARVRARNRARLSPADWLEQPAGVR